MASTDDHITLHGRTFYSKKNYNTDLYTFKNMKARDSHRLFTADLVQNILLSKIQCLRQAEKPSDTTLFALEKDEEYYPEFKECVKTTMTDFLNHR